MNLHDREEGVALVKAALEVGKGRQILSKGDVPGHEFRGNQYTDAGISTLDSKAVSSHIGSAVSHGERAYEHALTNRNSSSGRTAYQATLKARDAMLGIKDTRGVDKAINANHYAAAAHLIAGNENARAAHSRAADSLARAFDAAHGIK